MASHPPQVHIPVLLDEVISYLNIHPNGKYVDATLGAGGHAYQILSSSRPSGQLLGFEIDSEIFKIAKEYLQVFSDRAFFRNESYTHLQSVLDNMGWTSIDGIIFDLGMSSLQVNKSERGFSFSDNGPLDMRFDLSKEFTAEKLIERSSEEEISEILFSFGEETKAKAIAKAIIKNRPISTTKQLAELVANIYKGQNRKKHPATRTFQALRIAVNSEFENIKKGIEVATNRLAKGARIIVISFHSLEDRIVKNFFKQESKDCICPPEKIYCDCGHKALIKVITKKPVQASKMEIQQNIRSRSAKLRVAEKI